MLQADSAEEVILARNIEGSTALYDRDHLMTGVILDPSVARERIALLFRAAEPHGRQS